MKDSKALLWAIVVAVALIALWVVFRAPVGEPELETPSESTVMLNEQNESGQSGQATLEEEEGGTMVVITAEASYIEPQLAHIHSGTCEDLGGVVYPLSLVVGGYSETFVAVSLQELLDGEFAINLHDPQDPSIYTSCGDIQ